MVLPETLLADVQGNNIILFIVLILLFVIGYKLLQAVIRLGLVAILSGVFLVVLDMMGVGPAVTVQRFILFMVLGTGLFILYSSLATVLSITEYVLGFLTGILRWVIPSRPRKRLRRSRPKKKKDSGSKEKAIVLGEMDDD